MRDRHSFGLTTFAGKQPLIAAVIDNVSSAMVMLALLEQFGCRPIKATSGEQILALLRRESGVDLVIIDLPLRDMDGITVAQLIRTVGPHTTMPIVALADERSDITGRSGAADLAAIVRKPYSPRELYSALDAALARAAARARWQPPAY